MPACPVPDVEARRLDRLLQGRSLPVRVVHELTVVGLRSVGSGDRAVVSLRSVAGGAPS